MAETKDSLMKYFATLDVSTLERLKRYSSFIIIPDEDLLTSATMSQMVDEAHRLADSLFPEWTDRSKSDFGEFLVELFALFSEKDFWYINAFANEGTFRKIRSYSNAYSKASTLGYYPITCSGAEATFNVAFKAGEEIKYGRGELVVIVNGYEFTNDEEFVVEGSSDEVTKRIVLKEGTVLVEDVAFNGYCVFLRKSNIDLNSIRIKVEDVNYTRVNNFGDSGEDSKHFLVLPEEDGSCSVYFGSRGFGFTPQIGKVVRAEYRVCHGSDGNQLQMEVTINDSLTEREAVRVEMNTEAMGGFYAETLTAIKEKAPMFFGNKKSALNVSIAEQILNSYSFIHKSKVTVYGNNVSYEVIPKSGALELTNAEKRYLEEDFDKFIMLGYVASYASNNYVNFMSRCDFAATKVILEVVTAIGSKSTVVEAAVRQAMEDLTNPLSLAEYGGKFSKNETEILIRSLTPGIQSVGFKYALGTNEFTIPDFTLDETEIFRKINQDDLEVRIYAV